MPHLDPEKLKQSRKASGITQRKLAAASGISYSTLTKLEQGKITSPSVTVLTNIAHVLGCSMQDLLESASPTIVANKKIKFVYFDVGGVLLHWRSALHAFAERINRPYDDTMALFHTYNAAACRGNMTLEELQLLFVLRLNLDFHGSHRDGVLKNWVEDMRPITEGHELLKSIGAFYPVGLITNIFPGFYAQFLERGLVPHLPYKTVVQSCDVGVIKPEPRIYEIATMAAKVRPEEILFIDDTKINVKAAQEFGWQAEWFDEFKPHDSVARIVKNHFS